jgi:uncharacterized membrane protein required for colicin V production
MQPYMIDIVFALIALVLVITGWRRGFVRMAGGLMSLVLSIAAGIWGVTWIEDALGIPLSATFIGLIFAFLTIALIVSALINLIITLLDLARRLITMIPGLGLLHRLAGSAVGGVEAIVFALGVSYLAVYILGVSDIRTLLLSTETLRYGAQVLSALGL